MINLKYKLFYQLVRTIGPVQHFFFFFLTNIVNFKFTARRVCRGTVGRELINVVLPPNIFFYATALTGRWFFGPMTFQNSGPQLQAKYV